MKIVKVSATGGAELSGLLLRQTPGGGGTWGDCRFVVNQPVERCDWWVVCHGSALDRSESTYCDPNHIVYISMEPSEMRTPQSFLNQFSKLVLCDRSISHSNIQYANGLTWWVGMNVRHEGGHLFSPEFTHDFDSLMAMSLPPKQRRISVICSRNQSLPGHQKRLSFLDKLQQHPISEHIDFFGGGHRPIPDKWDAIASYKYHLVLENSTVPDYWSEKLGDAYLGFALPVYYGCPNVADYFSTDSLRIIDIDDFGRSVEVLEDLIRRDPFDAHLPAILQARNRVLNEYNILQMMSDICDKPAQRLTKCRLKPADHFVRSWPRRLARRLIYRLRGIDGD